MGIFSWLSGGVSHGDEVLYSRLESVMLRNLKSDGWVGDSCTRFKKLESDNGFFRDIYNVFAVNPMYDMLKDSDPMAFINSVASTSMIAGIDAVALARDRARSLFTRYKECLQMFSSIPPLEGLHNLLDGKEGPSISDYSLSHLIDSAIDDALTDSKLSYCSGDRLKAVAAAFYDMGNTMGFYHF